MAATATVAAPHHRVPPAEPSDGVSRQCIDSRKRACAFDLRVRAPPPCPGSTHPEVPTFSGQGRSAMAVNCPRAAEDGVSHRM